MIVSSTSHSPPTPGRSPRQAAKPAARELLEALGLNSVDALRAVLRPDQAAGDTDQAGATILERAEAVRDRYYSRAFTRIFEYPATAPELTDELEMLRRQTTPHIRKLRRTLEQLEPRDGERSGLLGLFDNGNNPIKFFRDELREAQRGEKLQQYRLALAIYEAMLQLLTDLKAWTEHLSNRRAVLDELIATALDIGRREASERERWITTTELVNDFSAGYEPYLAGALSAEPEPIARAQILRILGSSLTDLEVAEQPTEVLARVLFERVFASALIPAELAPRSLEAAVTLVAGQLGVPAPDAWQTVLNDLRETRGFAGSPSVPLDQAAEREGCTLTFQLVPDGHGPILGQPEGDAGLPVAHFVPGAPPARLGLVRVRTNFPLDAILPFRDGTEPQEPEGPSPNPFILPELAHPAPTGAGGQTGTRATQEAEVEDLEARTNPNGAQPAPTATRGR